jgi:hypothetical protein
MTVRELESKAWRLIGMAKVAVNKSRRKVLMQEAFDLASRASALRQLDHPDGEESNGGSPNEEDGYRMRLSNDDGTTLWIYLQSESRADAMWAANALAGACSDCFEDFDLWDGPNHVLTVNTEASYFFSFSDRAEEIAAASQQSLLDTEEAILHSEAAVAHSRKLLEATTALRNRLTRQQN